MNHLPDEEFRKLHFSQNVLKHIIFGYKTKQKVIDEIKNIVLDNYGDNVSFFKTYYDLNSKNISPELIRI